MNQRKGFTVNFVTSVYNHLNPVSSSAFSIRLSGLYNIKQDRLMVNDIREYYWLDLKLRDWKKEAAERQE